MGILNTLLGGNGQQTATGQHLQKVAMATGAQHIPISNGGTVASPYMQRINNTAMGATVLHNPSTWEMVSPLTEQIDELRYILKRTVENYDELVTQYKALQDITKAEENK